MKSITHYKDRVGQTFGRLTILSYCPKNHRGRYLCKCTCGNIKEVDCSQLVSGAIKSCGCLAKEIFNERNKENKFSAKHNHSRTRIYQIWADIKQRCYNPKQKVYKWYGAKGVVVCDNWKYSFLSFYNWCIENGYKPNLTIDRIDNKGNYEPNNCRFISMREQSRNRVNTIKITYNGKTQCLKDWCAELNKSYPTIVGRIRNGWQPLTALLTPKGIRRNQL